MAAKQIWIPMGDFQLEGELYVPDGKPRLPSAVLGHPHPAYGGDMDNNVIRILFDGLRERGRAVLRFNFRGVGKSGGSCGSDAVDDMEAAVDYLAKATGTRARDVAIVGYSYGAAVGCTAVASNASIGSFVGVAPPLAFADLSALKGCGRPVYLICADGDDYCPVPKAEELIEKCGSPKGLAIVPGADHFLRGVEEAVAAQVELFLTEANRLE